MNVAPPLNSGIYQGCVRHRRFLPEFREFEYTLFMVYLDLQELDAVFERSSLWSHRGFGLARFKREDYFDGESTPLYDSVCAFLKNKINRDQRGPVRMLTNLRYYGYIINPITCYYCFDETGETVETVIAEVTNTPWRQRCLYILNGDEKEQTQFQVYQFDKQMHVSPFQPMALFYKWYSQKPDENLNLHINVKDQNSKDTVFDATLHMHRHEMTGTKMAQFILRYPWMTMKVAGAIYWQATKLWLSKHRYFSNVTKQKLTIANKTPTR